jgi:predicted P-loop ATPase
MLKKCGTTARYNVISKGMQVNIPGMSGCPDNADNSAITYAMSLAALNGLPTGPVPQYLEAIADKHQFNPVMDYIQSKQWDGTKRINALADTLVTGPDFPETLKKTLVRKWLTSAVAAAAMPSGFRSRGVLSLQGPQSIGKTSWILKFIDDPLVQSQCIKIDHHLDPGNKDSVLTATSHWIVEIGEIDSSFKKDIARLKGFITNDLDKVRPPYGRRDAVRPRRTVFVSTVNHANFLVDDTGNSRWWTIPVISIDYNHDINMQQLWAQVYELFKAGKEWWLTPDEEAELETHNSKHRSVNSIRDLVCSALDLKVPEAERRSMSASELLRHLDINNPSNGQSRDCGAALRELLGEPRVSQGLNRWKVPLATGEDFHAVY